MSGRESGKKEWYRMVFYEWQSLEMLFADRIRSGQIPDREVSKMLKGKGPVSLRKRGRAVILSRERSRKREDVSALC